MAYFSDADELSDISCRALATKQQRALRNF
jgi:hypothetical protein